MTRSTCIEQLATAIAAVQVTHPTRVAIDGVDGVGKTSLAEELVAPLARKGREVVRASVDGFHRPRAARYLRGRDSAEGYFLDSFYSMVCFCSDLSLPIRGTFVSGLRLRSM